MKKHIYIYIMAAIFGAVLLLLARFVIKTEELEMLSGLCYGFGSACFVLGIGNIIGSFIVSKAENEEFRRKKEIEVNDERNVRIKEKVGTKINQIVFYLINILILTLGFMGANIVIILMLVGILIVELVLLIVLTNHYSKII